MPLRHYSNQIIKIFLAFRIKSTRILLQSLAKPEDLVKGLQEVTQCFRKQILGAPFPKML